MSFSMQVKEELETRVDTAKHCQIAEFAAFMGMLGRIRRGHDGQMSLELVTENEIVVSRVKKLISRLFNVSEEIWDTFAEGKKNKIMTLRITDQRLVADMLMTLKWCDEQFNEIEPVFVNKRLIQKDCCRRAFLRGAFMASGSISDPNKFYHYEIVCAYEEDADVLKDIMSFFNLDAKIIVRKQNYIVYLKEGNNITDVLNIMGAVKAQMELYNVMILKDISNNINRQINCETANSNKTAEASAKQTKDIEYIRNTIGLDSLKDSLREIALLRLENPEMNLKDLGEMLDPPVGKSGVNHRLRRISEIAEELRMSRGD
ncbi:MAG: DNA-binding protein WhiA [Lachnospira sp.]